MSRTQINVRHAQPTSFELFAELPALLATAAQPDDSRASQIEARFKLCGRILDALPLASDEYLFARNWLTSAQNLWSRGDGHVARFQVLQILRRLKGELCAAADRERKQHADIRICPRD